MRALLLAGLLLCGCGGAADWDALNEPTCALDGDYNVRYLPSPGCGDSNEFPARVEKRIVECDTPDQHCEPGVPSARCDFTRKLSETCEARVIWERSEP